MGSTEETGNSHLPLIGYNSKTPPISSPSPSNLRIVIWRRPVEEMKEVSGQTRPFCSFLGRFQFNQPHLCMLNWGPVSASPLGGRVTDFYGVSASHISCPKHGDKLVCRVNVVSVA